MLVEACPGTASSGWPWTGEAALRAAEKSAPDLLLLDIMMPGMDGYEVCRRLRADPATRELPIMFLSSLEDAQDKARGFELGGERLSDQAVRDPGSEGARALAAEGEGLRRRGAGRAGARPRDRARDPDGDPAVRSGGPTKGLGLEVHAAIEPARHVGGDLFEVLRLSEDRLLVAVGDVCGKGIPAALFMAVAVTLLRSLARQLDGPREILVRLNEELAAQNPRGMFVTMACLELRGGRATGANAGHDTSLWVKASGAPAPVFPSSGTPLGLIPGQAYASETLELGAGDTLVLSTDGVSEAHDAAGGMFGEERLNACFAGGAPQSAAASVDRVMRAVRAFAAGAPQSDDITIVAVRRTTTNEARH